MKLLSIHFTTTVYQIATKFKNFNNEPGTIINFLITKATNVIAVTIIIKIIVIIMY